jgi:hypothetical protein
MTPMSLGEYTAARSVRVLPKVLVRWMVISVPWPKGAPTRPDMLVTNEHDFEHEKARCLEMLDGAASPAGHAVPGPLAITEPACWPGRQRSRCQPVTNTISDGDGSRRRSSM